MSSGATIIRSRAPAEPWAKLAICLGIAFLTLLIYAPVRHYEFLNYDDDDYVSDNPRVLGGFTRENVIYSLAHFHSSNWHPITWFSHMADVAIWGKNAGGHHVTSVLIHAVNAVLLFLLLANLTSQGRVSRSDASDPSLDRTDTIWPSAFVAAVFAWHPLHIESVAWISERKDLLCAFFWILTTAAYVRYVRRPSLAKYLLIVLLFIFGLMSKPMIVSLPFVLLLLDYWPLGRAALARSDLRKWYDLFLEKTPLLLLAVIVGRLTISTQQRTGALKSALEFPWPLRIANIPLSYVNYIAKTIWPAKLAVLYPLPATISMWKAVGATILLVLITLFLFFARRRRPYLLVGWLWFIGVLIPVIGLVQVGSQAMADRYMYLPLIGLAMVGAWGGWDALNKTKHANFLTSIFFVGIVGLMLEGTSHQLRYWQNSVTLFQRAISITSDNGIAYGNLSAGLLAQSKPDDAAVAAREAIRILPNHAVGYLSLGMAMLMKKNVEDAIVNLEKAVQLQPDWPDAHQDLGGALIIAGRTEEAIPHFYETLKLSPAHVPALKAIAWIRATQPNEKLRDAGEAVRLGQEAVKFSKGEDPQALDVLAAGLAEAGRYDEAISVAEQARARALRLNNPKFAREISERVELYHLHLPYRSHR